MNSLADAVVAGVLESAAGEVRRHLERARLLVAEGVEALRAGFAGIGMRVYESRAPFVLVMHYPHRHPELNQRLSRAGVYVRDASTFHGLTPYHSRVSVRAPGDWGVVVEAFGRVVSGAALSEGSTGLHD